MRVIIKPFMRDMHTMFLLGRVKRVYKQFGSHALEALRSSSGLDFNSGIVIKVGFSSSDHWEGSAGYAGSKAISLLFPRIPPVDFDELALWLLMHELGHRLLEQHNIQLWYDKGDDIEMWHEGEHRLLFLFLIDALNMLGEQGERIIRKFPSSGYTDLSYGNTRAWFWANTLSAKERRELFLRIIKTRNLNLLGL